MSAFFEIAGHVFLLIGASFCVIGAIGIVRMPDFYSRIHAAGVTDTFGAGFTLLGLTFYAGPSQEAAKLLIALAFLWMTAPVASHALAKAAYAQGIRFDPESSEPGRVVEYGLETSEKTQGEGEP